MQSKLSMASRYSSPIGVKKSFVGNLKKNVKPLVSSDCRVEGETEEREAIYVTAPLYCKLVVTECYFNLLRFAIQRCPRLYLALTNSIFNQITDLNPAYLFLRVYLTIS